MPANNAAARRWSRSGTTDTICPHLCSPVCQSHANLQTVAQTQPLFKKEMKLLENKQHAKAEASRSLKTGSQQALVPNEFLKPLRLRKCTSGCRTFMVSSCGTASRNSSSSSRARLSAAVPLLRLRAVAPLPCEMISFLSDNTSVSNTIQSQSVACALSQRKLNCTREAHNVCQWWSVDV